MRIVTPAEVAAETQNKYLGVLVAAKFARCVNEFPRHRSVDLEQKLTTRALEELVHSRRKYRRVPLRRQEGGCGSPAGTSCWACRAGSRVTRAVRLPGGSRRPGRRWM